MQTTTFSFRDHDDIEIHVNKWSPEIPHRAIVQLSHGMQETIERYAKTAEALTDAGFIVYGNDHRGHGKTAESIDRQGILGPGGWQSVLWDMKQLNDRIKADHPGMPIFLFGHSWGSFLAQAYIERWGKELAGVIMSGTNGSGPGLTAGLLLAKGISRTLGAESPGHILEKITFAGFNKQFQPGETGREWLCSDPEVVRKYEEDPYCGAKFPNGFFAEMLSLVSHAWSKRNEARIPKSLPIYIFCGSKDPVSRQTTGVLDLLERYRKQGIVNLSHRIYPEGRHEMLNEVNKEEVRADLITWLNEQL